MNYLIKTTKTNIPIDEDELPKVMKAWENNAPVVVRQGIVNPNFIEAIIPDEHRKRGLNYGYEIDTERKPYNPDKQLPNEFAGVKKALDQGSLEKLKGEQHGQEGPPNQRRD